MMHCQIRYIAIVLAFALHFFPAQPALSTTANVDAFNATFEKIARSAIRSQFAGGGPICTPSEKASRALQRGHVSWLVQFSCSHKTGRKASKTQVKVTLQTHSFGHETASIRNWKDYMVKDRQVDNPIDHKHTDWVEAPAYIARVKQRWIRKRNPKRQNSVHQAWVAGEAKQAFTGIQPDSGSRPDDTPMAIRVVVEVSHGHHDIDQLKPPAGLTALAIADSIFVNLAGTEKPDVDFLDANPLFSRSGKALPHDWKPSELIAADAQREGAATDGQSRLIVRVNTASPARFKFALDGKNAGSLSPLLGGKTVELQGKHYAFALYTPPKRFDDAGAATQPESPLRPPKMRKGDIVEARKITVRIAHNGDNIEPIEKELVLVRPPVVLVHGLFADPITTWVNTFNNQPSMVALLERAGFLPFLVNYQKTNGMWDTGVTGSAEGSWLSGSLPDSSFAANRSVVWNSPLDTHSQVTYETGWFTEKPIRAEQQIPESIRIGGISKALQHYRNELNIAATQATVIGHSMGGLLARVWASENYNPDYHSARNYMSGDIYRLMTLNTPHHGSEVPELRDAVSDATIEGEPWLTWARRELVNTGLNWFLDPEPGAIKDLRPGSSALKQIGPTALPSLAISTIADPGQFGDPEFDPMSLYNSLYALSGTLFFENRPLLDRFIHNRFFRWQNTADPFRRETDWRGQSPILGAENADLKTFASIIGDTVDSAAYFWSRRRDAEFEQELRQTLRGITEIPFGLMRSQMGNNDDLVLLSAASIASQSAVGLDIFRFYDESKTADVPRAFMALMHDLIFHHDARSDGVVKLTSQIGGAVAHEPVPSVLHSYSPWTYAVQSRVLQALKWQPELFDPAGFPSAGELTPRFLPGRQFTDARISGDRAINWSGMVPAHARQYLAIADKADAVVLVRPVNPDSTRLLAENAAAKGMNVKGKSSNWGPQSGYIPANQRYSKLWRMFREPSLRNKMITKYDAQIIKSTTTEHPEYPGLTYAIEQNLRVGNHAGETCDVMNDPSDKDAEVAVIIKCGPDYFDWRNTENHDMPAFDPTRPMARITPSSDIVGRLEPLMVLADPTQEHRPYLTADYDLLAIGFRDHDGKHGPPTDVRAAKFHKVRGVITQRQWELVDSINRAVQDDACYTSGQVTHHGPENQYPDSPYVDYPILVFDPRSKDDTSDGMAYLVRQGPPGFRDIHLKRLFEEKIEEGFDLWPNPVSKGWQWEKRRHFDKERGYDPRDAGDLLVYVGEAPEPPHREFTNHSTDCGDSAEELTGTPVEPVQQVEASPTKESSENAIDPVQQEASEAVRFDKKTEAQTASGTEMAIWNDVKDSGSIDELGYYLELFPEGVFARLAKIRIRRLEADPAPAIAGIAREPDGDATVPRPPTEALERHYSSIDGYWVHISAHPQGGYIVGGGKNHDDRIRGSPWVAHLSHEGDILWEAFPASEESGSVNGLHPLSDGNTIISWTEGVGSKAGTKFRVGRYDATGKRMWSSLLGNLEMGYRPSFIAPLGKDGIAVAGPFNRSGDVPSGEVVGLAGDGSILWRTDNFGKKHERVLSLDETGGKLYVVSDFRKTGDESGATGLQLTVLSASGEMHEHTILETDGTRITVADAVAASNGDLIVVGNGNEDFGQDGQSSVSMVRFSPSGQIRWKAARQPERYSFGYTVRSLPDNSLLLSNYLTNDLLSDDFEYDSWIARYSADGELLNQSFLGLVGTSDIVGKVLPLHDGGFAFAASQATGHGQNHNIVPWLIILPPANSSNGNWPLKNRDDFIRACDAGAADPDDIDRPSHDLGVSLESINPAKAEPACRRAARYHPSHPRMQFNLGRVMERQNNIDSALEHYRQALHSSMEQENGPHLQSAIRLIRLAKGNAEFVDSVERATSVLERSAD